ncbi:MAG: hypothetical protein HW416_2355 [Chloroflexi bacterium]|nr:hypothetical protein [Chloroflexota bacterium]
MPLRREPWAIATLAGSRIADEIAASGPMTFARFMELALYDPDVGYYERAAATLGPDGDYLTSSTIHRAFAALLTSQLEEMWRILGQPSIFWLIEGGPGTGAFAAGVLETAAAAFPSFHRSLHVALIERSGRLRHRQTETLAVWEERVRWIDSTPSSWRPLGVGCVLANELLDAFPVHRVVMRPEGLSDGLPGRLMEACVDVVDGRFQDIELRPTTPALANQIAAGGGHLHIGQSGEVSLGAPGWVAAAAGLIERGYLLIMDYGAPAGDLYGESHPDGTLRSFWRHTMNRQPYDRVGEQDITAHVDFSAVTREAQRAGLSLLGATSQQKLLDRLGLTLLDERLEQFVPERAAQRAHRAALGLLSDPLGLGNVTAVAFGKQVSDAPLAGFSRTSPLEPQVPPSTWDLPSGIDELALVKSGLRPTR